MYTLILILLVSCIVSFITVPLIKRLAPVVGAMDVPQSSLQIHTRPIPRLGGLAIFFGFMAAVLAAILFGNPISAEAIGLMLPLLVAATAMLLLGTIDDIRGLQPYHRFAVQIPVAILLILFGIKVNIPSLLPLGVALTVFYVIGSCNSMNLLDGVDGLAAGVTAIASLAFGIVFLIQGQTLGLILSIALLGSTLGFLRHNFAPASIFMGDSGSLFLGFMLAVLA
ncbi:undecaprenyl/decaprenyl-phosphate alpha-N-acetylglucosaminyl 1-phosphate transferase, partial [bacterium]|nr:undecaprenyl/decaprenyl-phosphate alpha-N-acetylglucosaminyl 1-phosphate transferase [bacterium]